KTSQHIKSPHKEKRCGIEDENKWIKIVSGCRGGYFYLSLHAACLSWKATVFNLIGVSILEIAP
ncbi:hypothetical protein, partial [Prevotella fusca]